MKMTKMMLDAMPINRKAFTLIIKELNHMMPLGTSISKIDDIVPTEDNLGGGVFKITYRESNQLKFEEAQVKLKKQFSNADITFSGGVITIVALSDWKQELRTLSDI